MFYAISNFHNSIEMKALLTFSFLSFFFFFFVFLGLHPGHVEVPRLGVESEPHLQTTPQPMATLNP